MFKYIAALAAFFMFTPNAAEAHYTSGCQKNPCKMQVIKPYRASFLGPTGACESGTDGNLHHGLTAVDPWGKYRGRYQFGMGDWARAGGHPADPAQAGWLEQAYRAVVWLHVNGRQSWPNC